MRVRGVLSILLIPALAAAQAGSSTISGLVQDATGGVLPGVVVKVTNESTGVAVETVANEAGIYRVPALVPGIYTVDAALDGFQPFTRRTITLAVGEALAIDVTLRVAGQSEVVNVSAGAP